MKTRLKVYREIYGPSDALDLMEPILSEYWACDIRNAVRLTSKSNLEDETGNIDDVDAAEQLKEIAKKLHWTSKTKVDTKLRTLFYEMFGCGIYEFIEELEDGDVYVDANLRLALEYAYNVPMLQTMIKDNYPVEYNEGDEIPEPWVQGDEGTGYGCM